MAQTNFTPILTYKSDTASAVPSAGNLTNSANGAELAVNTADKRLFTKDSGGSVVELGTNPSSLTLPNGTANGVVYANGSKVLTTGSALTFDGATLQNSSSITSGRSGGADGLFALKRASDGLTVGALSVDSTNSLIDLSTAYSFLTFSNYLGEQMRLTPTGLGIGTSSPNEKLTVQGSGNFRVSSGNVGIALSGSGWSYSNYFNAADNSLRWFSSTGGDRLILDSSGNLGLGVVPSAWASVTPVFQVNRASFYGYSNEARMSANYYYNAGDKYIASDFATSYSQANGQHRWFTAPSGTAGNAISFTQALTLNTNGALVLQGGDTGANGVGVTFPATQSASSNANTLDDYEEGTWTPVLYFGGVNSSSTYYDQYGSYTKIGNQVFVRFGVRVNVLGTGGSSSDAAAIYGLPFTNYGVSYADSVGQLGGDCFTSTESGVASVANNSTWFAVRSGNGVTNDIVKSDFGNGKFVFGSFFYNVS